ncbi:hypothetical protein M2271_003598 [Streptomyces sp. LBL]|uniref:hypothetical protein n=1 Tax=Streptomyces sp. LBL TaxID=2940562 RepID=UPI0024746D30|nr:hypothetical protein [Streptomyces sp. LBL]MDH6625787.1 hypothetical protein [Streptomyces sp. LBL]
MSKISARSARGVSGDVVAWERIIDGVRYWFDATPYEVKVFRLNLAGGDLVHHWQDTPDVIGEYDRYDPSTCPEPGQVARVRHWDSNSAERQYVTSCRVCGDVVDVTREQLLTRHGDRYGTRTCEATGTAATLKAALVREEKQTPAEQRMSNAVSRWWNSCWGYDTLTGEECHHPICNTRPRVRR